MSSKRKKTSLSDASQSGSDSNDGGTKKWKEGGGASSSGSSDEGGNKSRSGSGSDSGTERSRSGSRAGSRNSGKSNSSKSSDSGTEGSDRPGSKKASGRSSSGSSSSGSGKSKKLKKASSRKPSSKMETSTLSHDSDSDEEQNAEKPKRKKSESPRKQKSDKESSSDEETWRDQFDDGLNDELIGDEDDKTMLEDMTEKEREEEIFKRAEKREELKKRFEITKKLEKQQKKKNEDQEDGELNENLSDDDMKMDYQTSSGRKKKYEEKYDKKFSALSELKAKREEKERKDAIRKQKESKKKPQDSDSDLEKLALKQANKKVLKASDVYSSSSDEGKDEERRRSSSSSSSSSSVSSISSGESDTERHGSKKLVKKAQILETQDQLEQIRLSRHKIEKFVHLPIFKRTAIGCYVRIGIGNDPTSQTNKPVYRVAEIVEICETAKTYSVGKAKTNIGLKLKHGKEERVFRVAFVSNQQFSDSEFNKWKEACVKGGIELPTVQIIKTKANDINKALNYRFSSADVDKVLASKEKFKVNPVNYAVYKAKLQKEKLQMEEAGNKEEADRIAKRLVEIEERAEELDKKRCSSISNIAYINNRNRKANIVKAEKAIYAEIKQKLIDGVDEDPFTRRRTAPKLPSAKKDENEDMTSELLLKLQQEKDQEKTKKKEEVVEKKVPKSFDMTLPKALQKQPEIKNDLFDAHDFDVEINVSEIQQNSIPSSINLKPVNNNNAAKASNGPTKRSLKIDEWKKKRGII